MVLRNSYFFVRLIVRIGTWKPEKGRTFKNLKGTVDIMELKDFSCMVLYAYM